MNNFSFHYFCFYDPILLKKYWFYGLNKQWTKSIREVFSIRALSLFPYYYSTLTGSFTSFHFSVVLAFDFSLHFCPEFFLNSRHNSAMVEQFKEQSYDSSGSEFKENEDRNLTTIIEVCHAGIFSLIEEDFERDVLLSCVLDLIRSTRKMLHGIGCRLHEQFKELELVESNSEGLSDKLVLETGSLCKIVNLLESRFREYEEMQEKEKRELESSILSLTEENRDISGLLKIAITEKEAMEKRSKGIGGDNRRAAILQIAEKGLQKVGFGFVMGVLSGDNAQGDSVASCNSSTKSDMSDGEEEVVSLVNIVLEKLFIIWCLINVLTWWNFKILHLGGDRGKYHEEPSHGDK